MVDQTTIQPSPEQLAEAASLRQALGAMRREAEQEVALLNERLRERSAAESPPASAAEQLALRQELDSIQRTLSAKEQALDSITAECRRLEDALEDQNLVFDGLRKEVERRDISLKLAQEEVERLRQSLLELQGQPLAHAPPEPAMSVEAPVGSRFAPTHPSTGTNLWALVGALTLVLLVALVWGRLDRDPAPPPGPVASSAPATSRAPGRGDAHVAPSEDGPPASTAAATPSDRAASRAGPGLPAVLERPAVQRDRLRRGGLGPALVALPGGRFPMGHNLTTGNDFGPAHEVAIAPFLMGAYEVTFEEFDRFARATGRGLPRDYGWGRAKRPVVGVTWSDARDYARWLSRETGRAYRLPSEAEWEYAARSGGRGSYWWGFGLEPNRAACFDCGSVWDNRSTAPVGSFGASPFGLYDTAGNAMEWVADCYTPGYRDAPSDGRARTDGPCTHRVARGGAFNRPSASMRTYVRNPLTPDTRLDVLGFRVARDR